MDLITKSYFKNFLKENNIKTGETDSNFEKFVNNLLFSQLNLRNFELQKITVGNGDDAGIDGFVLAINGKIIYSLDELEEILKDGMNMDIEFHFVQSKTSEKFEAKEIANFGFGVIDMFEYENVERKKMNDELNRKYRIIQRLLNEFTNIKSKLCQLNYVTVGTYVEDDNHKSVISKLRKNLKELDIFSEDEIKINILDKKDIRKMHEKTKLQNIAEFKLDNKIELPYIDGVTESYFAVMPINEYMKIVIDEDTKKIRTGIFELNVRDFEGIEENRVNKDITETLNSNNKEKFGLLNNGITIVGSNLEKSRGNLVLRNFFVVNGCQTTNVLYENRDKIDEKMWINVKFVISNDFNFINSIVKATNNQTEVTELQILSMSDYQDYLENYYKIQNNWQQLYYERRSGQYNSNNAVTNLMIISPEEQIKTFASIFLRKPHIASRFVGKLHEEISKSIFIKEHNPIMYYTSSLVSNKLKVMELNEEIGKEYNKFHYYILFIISLQVWQDKKMPQFESKKLMDTFCEELIEISMNEKEFKEIVFQSIEIINSIVPNLNSTEVTKSALLANRLQMYVILKVTENQISQINEALNIFGIDAYLIPIENISIDGDLRYNLIDRLKELKTYVERTYKIVNLTANITINENKNLLTALIDKVSESDVQPNRRERKLICKEVYNYTIAIKKEYTNILNASKRYLLG